MRLHPVKHPQHANAGMARQALLAAMQQQVPERYDVKDKPPAAVTGTTALPPLKGIR